MIRLREALILLILGLYVSPEVRAGPYTWMSRDNFDYIMDKISTVNAENCRSKPKQDLQLDNSTVPQVPRYNKLLSTVYYSNRSSLLHLHDMALNRAFFYSFVFQALNKSEDFAHQPGVMYIYMSATADVTGGTGMVNGSALAFDEHCFYPNYLITVDFNNTLPLYAPYAWRADDYNEPTNWLREPTNRTVDIHDLAAGRMSNYTNREYKMAPWYKQWGMPDIAGDSDSLDKYTYSVGIKWSNTTGKFTADEYQAIPFFGPPQPGQQTQKESLPVLFTQPYFDCGRSNKWIVSASAPVVEFMPRYSQWVHLRRARFVAIVTQNIEFERIDINPCPVSEGNPAPNYFAGIDRCKPTTMCEPLSGYGFRRGGYQCVCRAGFYYPWWHDGPFQGWEIEESTWDEYETGFECLAVQERQVIPNVMPEYVKGRKKRSLRPTMKAKFLGAILPASKMSSRKLMAKRSAEESKTTETVVKRKKRFVARYKGETRKIRNKRDAFDAESYDRMQRIMERKYTTNPNNCGSKLPYQLLLPGDAAYGVERMLEAQGRTALRLSHFLCNFLQNVDEYEEFGAIRGDRRLNETQILGEVIANVMSDFKTLGSGVFFDRWKFRMSPEINNTLDVSGITREFFGPYAWRVQTVGDGLDDYKAEDFAGHKTFYTDEDWFRRMKARWQTNFSNLKRYTAKPMIRSDNNGTSSVRFEHYPLLYYAPQYEHGEWLRPRFMCDNRVMDWAVTYVVPFFGRNALKTRLEFKGVVTIDVSLDALDINQCPASFYVANAFKNTARCHYKSTYCVPLEGKRFNRGGYKCECRQGFEYTFNDLAWYFDGQTMEEEYSKYMNKQDNRYPTLRCRYAGASSLVASWALVLSALVLLLWYKN